MDNHKELIERLKIDAEWAEGQEWETPLCLWDDLMAAASTLATLSEENARLRAENIRWDQVAGEQNKAMDKLRAELEQVKRERDAAIEDLASVREITPEAEYAINKHADSLIKQMDALLHQDDSELEAYRALGSIDHLRELVQAEKKGRLVVFPFIAMIEQSLQEGKMKPQRDQRFNGRYAVVYSDKKKWASPLIDICGRPYNREQAEERLAALTHEEAEAALSGGVVDG